MTSLELFYIRVPNCPSFIADCGHTQPGQKIHSVTEKLVQRRSALLTEDNAKADFNKNILNVERLAKITTETKVKRKRVKLHNTHSPVLADNRCDSLFPQKMQFTRSFLLRWQPRNPQGAQEGKG